MPEMDLIHLTGFTNSACGSFIKNKEKIRKKLKKHDMVYGDFKDLNGRTASHKLLRNKSFNIVKNAKCDEYQREFASMVYKFIDKKTYGGTVKNEIISNKELAEELDKALVTQKYTRRSSRHAIDK